jgi:hypothetical protein
MAEASPKNVEQGSPVLSPLDSSSAAPETKGEKEADKEQVGESTAQTIIPVTDDSSEVADDEDEEENKKMRRRVSSSHNNSDIPSRASSLGEPGAAIQQQREQRLDQPCFCCSADGAGHTMQPLYRLCCLLLVVDVVALVVILSIPSTNEKQFVLTAVSLHVTQDVTAPSGVRYFQVVLALLNGIYHAYGVCCPITYQSRVRLCQPTVRWTYVRAFLSLSLLAVLAANASVDVTLACASATAFLLSTEEMESAESRSYTDATNDVGPEEAHPRYTIGGEEEEMADIELEEPRAGVIGDVRDVQSRTGIRRLSCDLVVALIVMWLPVATAGAIQLQLPSSTYVQCSALLTVPVLLALFVTGAILLRRCAGLSSMANEIIWMVTFQTAWAVIAIQLWTHADHCNM